MKSLQDLYAHALSVPSDIREHLPTLHALAAKVQHVTEFGVRYGDSTIALLAAQPRELVCVDIAEWTKGTVDKLIPIFGRTKVTFFCADTRSIEIEKTDLLFIDTEHTHRQLGMELRLHSPRVARYIAMHDTELPGMQRAVDEFVANENFSVTLHRRDSFGFTVLERK